MPRCLHNTVLVLLLAGWAAADEPARPRAARRADRIAASPPPTQPPLQPVDVTRLPTGTERLDLYLLLGQSNMKGRGEMPAEPSRDPHIVCMHMVDDRWYVARHPLHLTGDAQTFAGHDNAGIGPGLAFAETVRQQQPAAAVGLIPCAVGGSSIVVWQPGAKRYEDAVRRARLAIEQTAAVGGKLRGALWLQGEANANEKDLAIHRERLESLIDGLRRDLQQPDLPFIACTIGELRDDRPFNSRMNELLLTLPSIRPHTACVDARDLKTHIGDAVHFDTAAQNEIGRRYAAAYRGLTAISPQAGVVGPWNLGALFTNVPEFHWLRQDQPVHSLLYAGEEYQGHATEVFAFYASPRTLGREVPQGTKFPGVVLIHGGGGTAFADWAQLWAERGYAAIAMDLAGSRPPDPTFDPATGKVIGHQSDRKLRTRLPNGGPFHDHGEKFDSIGGEVSDDWPFHAAASVIRAHTLLRSLAEVDAEHTAVTGISWGGYTTCLVASLDSRFRAAVPVYGCGFLHEGESVQKPSIDKLGDRRQAWVDAYDPGSLLPRCRVPILFVNGTNDVHYVLDSYMKSFDVIPGPKQMRVTVKMPHGHPPGWAPQEIGLFIDSHCRQGEPLAVPQEPAIVGDEVHVTYKSAAPLKAAHLHYTTDGGLRSERNWTSVAATVTETQITAAKPPADANTWFLTLTDARDATVSTTVQFQD